MDSLIWMSGEIEHKTDRNQGLFVPILWLLRDVSINPFRVRKPALSEVAGTML